MVIYVSGSILNFHSNRIFQNKFFNAEIRNVYGLTECGPRVSANIENCCRKINSVGKPLEGVNIKIDRDGEILVKTKSLFSGYIGMDNKNKSQWWHTKDIGFLDEEGDLFITGRLDNMITCNSHNIFPEEMENILESHLELDDIVILPLDDELRGIILVCLYVGSCTTLIIRNECINLFANYERPKIICNVSKLLYNQNGKKIRELKHYIEKGIISTDDLRFHK